MRLKDSCCKSRERVVKKERRAEEDENSGSLIAPYLQQLRIQELTTFFSNSSGFAFLASSTFASCLLRYIQNYLRGI